MLFFVTSALAFSAPKSNLPALATPKSNLLALRGGGVVSTDVLYNTQAGLIMLTGLQGWLAPVNTLEMYGVKSATDGETAWLRVVSGMNVVLAVTMVAAQTGLDTAVTACALAFAFAVCYNVPVLEKFGVEAGQLAGFVVVLGAVGELARRGIMPASWAFNFMVFGLLIAGSVADRLVPQQIMDMYKMPAPTALMKSLFMNFSLTKVRWTQRSRTRSSAHPSGAHSCAHARTPHRAPTAPRPLRRARCAAPTRACASALRRWPSAPSCSRSS